MGYFDLSGRVAIVTGGGAGIGEAISARLAKAGAKVFIADIDPKVAETAAQSIPNATALPVDVTNSASVNEAFGKVEALAGSIDILVNNAGIETIVPFLELTDDQWTRLVDVNLRGEWLCSQVFCRRVLDAGRKGVIVNIGSIQAGKILPGRTHYAPTKLGLEALTRNISAEMSPLGIRANCVHPGLIDTDMTAWVMQRPDLLPGILAQISLGRPGEAREIGTVVAFFASDEASYLTGQSIHVDGGWVAK